MKLKPILTAFAVALAALAQPALAEWKFTQNEKGEVTHYNGIPLPPMQTVEEAKAQAQKEIAAAQRAREAQQAEQPATRYSSPATPPEEVFFTGKPYLEETGQYLFLFRHYDPELARWTTADPSGFPDGANNIAYCPIPTHEADLWGLRATAAALWGAYPRYGTVSTAGVWAMAGGWLNQKYLDGDADYQNSCALRLSIALNGAGHAIQAGAPGANLCEGSRYIINAARMHDHISAEWGAADETLGDGGLGGLQARLTNGRIAVVINGGHVGIVTNAYSDPHTPYTHAGSMSVWILE